jgi:hypothetical protein
MNDPTRIEEMYGLPRWVQRAVGARLAAAAAAKVKASEARNDVAELVHHVRAICGDEDARAWFLAIGVDKATLRRFWNKAGGGTRKPRTGSRPERPPLVD